jgi:hypothetical protein
MFLILFLAGCAGQAANRSAGEIRPSRGSSELPDLGEAPEINNSLWLNTETPLHLADLRGQVVLLDMWTYG